jgi:hypothetical protein
MEKIPLSEFVGRKLTTMERSIAGEFHYVGAPEGVETYPSPDHSGRVRVSMKVEVQFDVLEEEIDITT